VPESAFPGDTPSQPPSAPNPLVNHAKILEAVVRTIQQPLVVLTAEGKVELANPAFYELFRVQPAETETRHLHEVGPLWAVPELRRYLERFSTHASKLPNFRIEHEFERIGRRVLLLNATRIKQEENAKHDRILVVVSDITETDRIRFELIGQKEFAEKIVDAVRDPLLILGWDLRVQSANQRFYTTFQVDPAETEGQLVYDLGNGQWNIPRLRDLLERILPHDIPFDDFEVEHEFEKIGRKVMLLNARRINHHRCILLAIQDITRSRRSEGEQKLLMGELQHRVKNILMNVRALANQTRRASRSLDDFSHSFEGRLDALARTQDLLVRSISDSARLGDLIRFELGALGADEGPRVKLEGPTVELPARVAQPMSLTVHELATNAAKYGALSTESGTIAIKWAAEGRASDRCVLRMNWRERGLRLMPGQRDRGFGTELIERSLPHLFGGFSRLSYHPDGVECQIEFAMPSSADYSARH
jgi:two-component sensor histidine kinase